MDLLGLVEDVGTVATAAVLAVVHGSHENTSATGFRRAFAAQPLNLAIAIDLVVLEHSELGLLALVLDLLGSAVDLLLALLRTTTEAEDEVESGLLLDVVVRESSAILELLAGEDETLLIGWNSLLVLNLRLYIVDGIRGFYLEGNRLTREGLDEDLHGGLDR